MFGLIACCDQIIDKPWPHELLAIEERERQKRGLQPRIRDDTLIDRLLHRAEIIDIEGDSSRLKEAKERAATQSATRAKERA